MDQQIKERMVGAGVLVLAAVIFIPMLLSGPTTQHDGLASAAGVGSGTDSAQASAENGFSSRIVPLESPTPAPAPTQRIARDAAGQGISSPTPAKKVDKPPVPVGSSNSSASARSDEKSRPPAKAKPKPPPKPPPRRPSKPPPEAKAKPPAAAKGVRKAIAAQSGADAAGGWVVQLGSFSSARNAHALRDRLKSKGYKAFARSSGSGAQAVTRIYVGPDASRERARQRVSRLLAETRLKGIVIRHPK